MTLKSPGAFRGFTAQPDTRPLWLAELPGNTYRVYQMAGDGPSREFEGFGLW